MRPAIWWSFLAEKSRKRRSSVMALLLLLGGSLLLRGGLLFRGGFSLLRGFGAGFARFAERDGDRLLGVGDLLPAAGFELSALVLAHHLLDFGLTFSGTLLCR